jgi:hypothetical protein
MRKSFGMGIVVAVPIFLGACAELIPKHASLLEPAKLFPPASDTLAGSNNSGSIDSALDRFIAAANDAFQTKSQYHVAPTPGGANPSSDSQEVFAKYVSKGITLSDEQCDEWLDALSHQNTELSLGTGWFNVASNTLVSALGLAGAASGAISGVGMGSAAINATTQEYRAAVLFTPDFATLHQKIDDARKGARSQMLASTYTNVDDATRDLITYDKMCSRDSVQLLLQQSLASSQYQIPSLAQPAAAAGAAPPPVGAPPPPPPPPAASGGAPAPLGAPSSTNRQYLLQSLPPAQVVAPTPPASP